jgi:hypothetical protein
MSESSQQIRWVRQSSNWSRILYPLLAIPICVVAVMVVSFLEITILPKGLPPNLLFYGTIAPIFLIFGASLYLIVTGPDGSRPAQVEAAAGRLGLTFATRADGNDLALPPEFPLARASAQWILPRRRGPQNLIYGEVGGRRVSMFDIAYPSLGSSRFETTAVYFPDPVPGLPDWPENCPRPGYSTGPPEPFASVLATHPVWTVECRGGRLLLYRLYYLCHPDSYPEFAAAAAHVYAGIAAAAGGGESQGVRKANFQDERLPDG